jgi:hypothetical protein
MHLSANSLAVEDSISGEVGRDVLVADMRSHLTIFRIYRVPRRQDNERSILVRCRFKNWRVIVELSMIRYATVKADVPDE